MAQPAGRIALKVKIGGLIGARASAALLAACGSGGGSSTTASTSDFASAADQICTDRAHATVDVRRKYEPVQDAQSAAKFTAALADVNSTALGKLKALEAPSSANSSYQQFLDIRDQMQSQLAKGVTAAKAGDEAAYNKAEQEYLHLSNQADSAAADAGLTVCAEKLSADQESAARAVVTRTGTANDPSQCTDDYTAAFVKAQWGSVSACQKAQKKGSPPLDGVDIKTLVGVDSIYADATVLAHGGSQDGQTLDVSLIYEDGSWKVDSVSSEPSSS
jgi:hypothetical protein